MTIEQELSEIEAMATDNLYDYHRGKEFQQILKLIGFIRHQQEVIAAKDMALAAIAENAEWSLGIDDKSEYGRACGTGCDGTHGKYGRYDVRNGHDPECKIDGARKALAIKTRESL